MVLDISVFFLIWLLLDVSNLVVNLPLNDGVKEQKKRERTGKRALWSLKSIRAEGFMGPDTVTL